MHSTQKLPIKQVGQPLTSACHHIESPTHLSPQPKTFRPRPPQWTLQLQCHSNGAPRIQDIGALKPCPPWHMVHPRRQRLVPWPCPSPLSVLTRIHCGNTWRMHRRHCSVVSRQGTHTNVLVNRLGHCGGARFNHSSPVTAPGFSNITPSPTVKLPPSK